MVTQVIAGFLICYYHDHVSADIFWNQNILDSRARVYHLKEEITFFAECVHNPDGAGDMTFSKRFCIACLLILAGGLAVGPAVVAVDDAVAFESATIPDTDAGRHLSEYLAAHNSGDREAIQTFVGGHYSASALAERSIPERVPGFVGFYSMAGQLKPFSVTSDGDYAVKALALGEGDGQWYGITVTLEANPPHKIAQIAVDAGAGEIRIGDP